MIYNQKESSRLPRHVGDKSSGGTGRFFEGMNVERTHARAYSHSFGYTLRGVIRFRVFGRDRPSTAGGDGIARH